ncbi:hypothetical protein E4U61_007623, partial [Claviceps capensis]
MHLYNSNRFKVLSRLRRTFNLTERVPCTELLPPAPPAPDPTNGLSKEEAAAALRKNPPDADAVVYSDGSKEFGDDAGFGYVVYRDGTVVASGKGRLARSEVYDGEVW